jgi:hypothetical protein
MRNAAKELQMVTTMAAIDNSPSLGHYWFGDTDEGEHKMPMTND